MQAADQGIWLSQDGRSRYVNRRMAELMGCSIDELLAHPAIEFVAPEYLDAVKEPRQLVRDGHRQRFEVRLCRRDGSSFLAEVSVTPLHDAAGTYTGEVAVVSDVTVRNQAESEARIRTAVLDAIGQAVLAGQPDGTIVYANPAAERLLGWRASELVGRNGFELLAPPDAAASATRICSKLLAKHRYTDEVVMTRRDGTHVAVHVTGAAVLDARREVVGIIAVLSDNSERDRLEQEARTQEQQAEMVALLGARALQHSPQELSVVLTDAVEATRRLLQIEHATLLEVVPGGNDLAIRVSSPATDDPTIIPSGFRSLAGYTALAGKVVRVEDARRDRRFGIDPMPGQLGIISAIAAPVFGPSGVCGVLTADSTTPHKFNLSAVHFMQSIANAVGIALQHQ
jgi:PAS domain S-box-containing protein